MRILYVARGLSLFGNYLQFTALPLWILATTGSPAATGLGFTVEVLPVVLLAPIVGYLVDRYDRRTVLAVGEGLSAVATAALIAATSSHLLPAVYGVMFVLRAFDAFATPAATAILRAQVPATSLPRAIGTIEGLFGFVVTVGPIIGTLFSARFGIQALLAMNLATFVVSSALTSVLLPRCPGSPTASRAMLAVPEALRTVVGDRELRAPAFGEIAYFLFFAGITSVALAVAHQGVGSDLTGLYTSGIGVGWLLGSLVVVRRFGSHTRPLLTVGFGGCAVGGLAIAFVVGADPVGCFLGGAVCGLTNVMVVTTVSTVYAKRVPVDRMGRVVAVRRAWMNLALVISNVALSSAAAAWGLRWTAVAAGLLTAACGVGLVGRRIKSPAPAALAVAAGAGVRGG
ncbi:MFS transporter [Mangrovihabitans endophyticus]|uniref:Major facilitator superfamily (MFS) profile domain-containing protein n=1 Tax=Mangrovihabitans endophyticus TaxID=1751298 RepID=A0A8J3FKE6_9ACTN|nr:MFS transporter [Mangrovihabitans endophyticus]GGK72585.1 hypothetical protein GCM10012284_02960 [Mangrovihabitans endophyticus]